MQNTLLKRNSKDQNVHVCHKSNLSPKSRSKAINSYYPTLILISMVPIILCHTYYELIVCVPLLFIRCHDPVISVGFGKYHYIHKFCIYVRSLALLSLY